MPNGRGICSLPDSLNEVQLGSISSDHLLDCSLIDTVTGHSWVPDLLDWHRHYFLVCLCWLDLLSQLFLVVLLVWIVSVQHGAEIGHHFTR